jgi:hypothetical protein
VKTRTNFTHRDAGQNIKRGPRSAGRARPLKRTALLAKPVNGINAPQRPDCVADDAVSCEPVSAPNSLLTGKLTGNFAKSGLSVAISCPINAGIQCLTAKFPTQQNREFSNAYQGIFFGEQGNLIKRERDAVIAVRRHLVGDGADAFHLPICRL